MLSGSRELFTSINEKVAAIDPLGADPVMVFLPRWNETGNLEEIIHATTQLIHSSTMPTNRTEAMAGLRDLGMFAGSLRRHGYEPVEYVMGLEEVLLRYGGIADGVPRDTFFSYTLGNPSGERRRRFTNLPEEEIFISSLSKGLVAQQETLLRLVEVYSLDLKSSIFSERIEEAIANFDGNVHAMADVYRSISPDVFTNQMRPFFDPIKVQDREYLAPAGSQMPMLLIDYLLWGSNDNSEEYRNFFNHTLPYLPKECRELSTLISLQGSLLSRVKVHLERKEPTTDEKISLDSIIKFINRVIAFRRPHMSIAEANFKLREPEAVGSGGYSMEILEYLFGKTVEARDILRGIVAV